MAGLDAGLNRNRDRNEIDPARRELVAEIHDSFYRVWLDTSGVRSMGQDFRLKERRAGDCRASLARDTIGQGRTT